MFKDSTVKQWDKMKVIIIRDPTHRASRLRSLWVDDFFIIFSSKSGKTRNPMIIQGRRTTTINILQLPRKVMEKKNPPEEPCAQIFSFIYPSVPNESPSVFSISPETPAHLCGFLPTVYVYLFPTRNPHRKKL